MLLAIDGGQTGTRALLADAAGNVLATADGEPLDPLRPKLGALVARLDRVDADVAATCVGLTSVEAEDSPHARDVAAAAREFVPEGSIRVVPDREAALTGAIDDHGVVLIAGGGAIATGIGPRGEQVVVSGYGYRIGEDGSAVDLGRRAVAAALRGWEGRGAETALTGVVAAAFGVGEPRETVGLVYAPGFRRVRLAALAPAVLDAAEAGDDVAAALVGAAAEELAQAAVAAARSLYGDGEPARIVLTGGLLRATSALTRRVEARIVACLPHARVTLVPHASAAGALVLAAREAGISVDREWTAAARASVAQRHA